MPQNKCRICSARYSQAGDGYDGMCPACADKSEAVAYIDTDAFKRPYITGLEDDSHSYGADPGTVFAGALTLLGTHMNVSLIWCKFTAGRAVVAEHKDLQRLVDAALDGDPDIYRDERSEPKWVQLPGWHGRNYLLTCAPGRIT